MHRLWGGRFKEGPDEQFARFNASFPFDCRLLEADILTAEAHVRALERAGALTPQEASELACALASVRERALQDPAYLKAAIDAGVEDVHSFVEQEVSRLVGPLGLKLNTGRSRNDQVACDLRVFVRKALRDTSTQLKRLQSTLLDKAAENPEAPLPGYTHLQRAQPVLFAHFLLAYFEMFQRDRERLADCDKRADVCPLGSGALAGTNYPLDRQFQAETLGFGSVTRNSMDAVSDRDFVVEFTQAASLIMMHLSRLSEDLILYSTSEFAFVELGDSVTTGSSLLPQKKNPDGLELIRGKSGRVFGHAVALLTLLKGLPLTYNKDLQEDKEPLFDTVDTLAGCLAVMIEVIWTLQLRKERLAEASRASYLNATELADYLAQRGLPFREAHHLVGQIVRYAIEHQKSLDDLSLDQLRQFSDLFAEDVFQCLTLEAALSAKSVEGGTAPQLVRRALEEARRRLQDEGS